MSELGEVLRRKLFRQPMDSRAPKGILASSEPMIKAANGRYQVGTIGMGGVSTTPASTVQQILPASGGVGIVGQDTPPPMPGQPGAGGVVGTTPGQGSGGSSSKTSPELITQAPEEGEAGAGTGPSLADILASAAAGASDKTDDNQSSSSPSDLTPEEQESAGTAALAKLFEINEKMNEAGSKAEKKKAAKEARQLLTEMGIDAKDIRTEKDMNLMMFGLTLASTPGSIGKGLIEAGKATLGQYSAGKAAEQKTKRELNLAAAKMGLEDVGARQARLQKRSEQLTDIVKEEIKASKEPPTLKIARTLMAEMPDRYPTIADALVGAQAKLGGAESEARKALIDAGVPEASAAILSRSPEILSKIADGTLTVEDLNNVIAQLAGKGTTTVLGEGDAVTDDQIVDLQQQ